MYRVVSLVFASLSDADPQGAVVLPGYPENRVDYHRPGRGVLLASTWSLAPVATTTAA